MAKNTIKGDQTMKKGKFFTVFMFSYILSLTLASIAFGGKPSFNYYPQPGYVMFNDSTQYVIRSDGGGVYADCSYDGTDMVQLSIWDDGTFQGLHFYPGVMQKSFYNCAFGTFSLRRVNFYFNVSGITATQPAGDQNGNAVLEILRWINESGDFRTDASGFINDGSLHVPMDLYRTGHAWIQFGIDPTPSSIQPGSNPKAVTQDSVNSFYDGDIDTAYWCTRTEPDREPAPYVLYNIDYGRNGVDVQSINSRTWRIKTKARKPTDPVRLYVRKDNQSGQAIYLLNYASVPFELIASLDPITSYPNPAPPKTNTISTTWGELKE